VTDIYVDCSSCKHLKNCKWSKNGPYSAGYITTELVEYRLTSVKRTLKCTGGHTHYFYMKDGRL
jgi:hypothetical protein